MSYVAVPSADASRLSILRL